MKNKINLMISNNKIFECDDRGFMCIEGKGWKQSSKSKKYLKELNKEYLKLVLNKSDLLLNKFLDKYNIYKPIKQIETVKYPIILKCNDKEIIEQLKNLIKGINYEKYNG